MVERNRSGAERWHHRERLIRKRIERIKLHNFLDPDGGHWNDWKQAEDEPAIEVMQSGRWAKNRPYTLRMWCRDDWGDGPMGIVDRRRGEENDSWRIHGRDIADALRGDLEAA